MFREINEIFSSIFFFSLRWQSLLQYVGGGGGGGGARGRGGRCLGGGSLWSGSYQQASNGGQGGLGWSADVVWPQNPVVLRN